MQKKLLTTTLLSMSLLSLNLAVAGNCTGSYCVVDLSKPSSKKVEIKKDIIEEESKTVLIDNIETIILAPSKYVMTEDEVGEYELNQMKILGALTTSSLTSEGLTISDEFCEDNLTPVLVVGTENTYECIKS